MPAPWLLRLYWRLSFLIKITSLRHFLFDGLGRNSPGQIQRSVPHTNDFIWKAKGTKGRGLFTSRFSSLGYRDEWLADAVSYMDRLAVNMHTCDEMPQMQGRSKQAAAWTMSCESLWMASVYIALKMSEAESEVDLALIDLLSPLVPLKEGETKLSRQRLTQIKKDEIFIARRLDFRLMVPTALELVQHMSREICRHVPKCQAHQQRHELCLSLQFTFRSTCNMMPSRIANHTETLSGKLCCKYLFDSKPACNLLQGQVLAGGKGESTENHSFGPAL
eukprot:s806_g15.t1